MVEQRPRSSNLRTQGSARNNGFSIRAIDSGGVAGRRFSDRHFRERAKLVSRPVAGGNHVAGFARYSCVALAGEGHLFTPVASATLMTMLLAWKVERRRFAGVAFGRSLSSLLRCQVIASSSMPLVSSVR